MKLPKDLTIQARCGAVEFCGVIEAASDKSSLRKFRFSPLYSGGQLHVGQYPHPVVIDVEGIRPADQITVRHDHKADRVIGHGTARIDKQVHLEDGVMSFPGPTADEVIAASGDGFTWQSSITLTPDPGAVRFIARGRSLRANGRVFRGPMFHVLGGFFPEASFVDTGGDREAAAELV